MLDTPHELEMQEGMATGSSQASFCFDEACTPVVHALDPSLHAAG